MAYPAPARRAAATLAFLFLVALGATAPHGQEPAATGLVSIDFLALTADGQPIPDLRVDQVTLKVDGKARDIRSLQLVTLDNARPGAVDAPAAPVSALPAPFGTNALSDNGGPSRTVVIIVDTETLETNKERPMRDAVALLLNSFGARDRVALVTVPFGTVNVDFTQDRQKIVDALSKVTGQAKTETTEESDIRTSRTLNALRGSFEDLAGGEGPTTVLFFSAGLRGISQAQVTAGGTAGSRVAAARVDKDEFQNVGKAAARARINLYIIPPDTSPISQPSLEGLQNLEGVTGGKRLAIQTASETALNRVARETSAYYVATFAPEANELNGLAHSVDLKASRSGVTLRNAQSVFIEKPGLAAGAVQATAKDMLRETKVRRELALRVSGYTSRNTGDSKLRIDALAEPIDPAAVLASASMGLFDSAGHLVAQWSALGGDLAPYPLHAAMLAPAGNYRLRVAATDTFGRVGSADYDLNAELVSAGSVKLSSVVLGLSRSGQFQPRMQFGQEASAIAQLQIYGQLGKEDGAMLELCDTLNGQGFLPTRLVIEATSEPDRFLAKGTIPVGLLPAGDFVLRAIVQRKGEPEVRVVQTIRKVVK